MTQVFTSTQTNVDVPALIGQLRATLADNTVGVSHDLGSERYLVDKGSVWTAGQIASAQNVIDAAPAITPQRNAQNYVDNLPLFEKAFILTLIDQINMLRTRAGLSTVTNAQVLQAIKDKAATL